MKDQVMIVTGAAMGLGLAAAKEFASRKANLVLVDQDAANLQSARDAICRKFPNVKIITITADVSSEASVKGYVDETLQSLGRIDGLYNNAGIEGRQAGLAEYDVGIFKRVIDINLMGVFYGMRHVLPVMQKQEYGRIVNAASVGGLRALLNHVAYVASKHAVSGMTKNAAIEYGRYGILTNAIAPGAILTSMVAEAFNQINPQNPKAAEIEYAKRNPTRRLGVPEEVAKVVAFLISRDNGYVSGQTIAIDGGESNIYGNAQE